MTPSTDTASPPKDTGGSDNRIDAIVDGINKTSSRIQAAVAQGPTSVAAPPPPPPAPTPSQAPTTPPPPPSAEPADTLVDPPKDAAPGPDAAIESLDAQLAELTAELLDSRAATPGQIADPPPAPAVESIATPTPAPAPPAPTAAEAPTAPPAPSATQAPAPAAIAPPTVPSTPVQAPVSPPAKPTPNRAQAEPSAAITPPGPLLRAFAIFSKPLAGKSSTVRNVAGLLGINSLLLAAGVWAFVAFRPAPVKPVEQDYDFATADLPKPHAEKPPEAAHAPPGEEHGASEHAEGHEGEAKAKPKPKTPKKPPPKADKKSAAKKAAKPADEHGGHE